MQKQKNHSLILKSILRFATVLIAIFSFSFGFSQEDSTAIKIDSANLAAFTDYQVKLSNSNQQRAEDSIQRKKLEAQIKSLSTTDNLKKQTLEAQIKAINDKDSVRFATKKMRIDSLKTTAKGYVVHGFFKDTLFLVYSRIGSFTAKERTKAINKRIQDLGNNVFFDAKSLRIEESENMKNIVFGDDVVMSITETDAIWNDTSRSALATHYAKSITDAVLKYKSETDYTKLAKKIGLALFILIVIGIIIRYQFKLFAYIETKIRLQKDKKIKGIKIKNYMLVNANSQISILVWFNTVFKWITTFLIVYFSLPFIFGLFPWTEHLAGTLFGYVLAPLKRILLAFWNYLPNLITIIITIVIFRYTLRAVKILKNEIQHGRLKMNGFYAEWANPTYQIIRLLLIAFAFIVIFPYLPGSDSPVFQAVSVFLGFLLTFGSSGSLSHIISGIVITYMRLFAIGDRIKIGEVTGDVIEKSALVTRLRTSNNEIVSVPNSTVMSSHTVNYSTLAKEKGLILTSSVNISYEKPWVEVYAALEEAANRTELLLKNPKPFALQHSLSDSFVEYEINAYTTEANSQATVYSRLHENIRDVFNEKGIEILSPNYNAIRDGNDSTISDKPSEDVEKQQKSEAQKKTEELLEKNVKALKTEKASDYKKAIVDAIPEEKSKSPKTKETIESKSDSKKDSDTLSNKVMEDDHSEKENSKELLPKEAKSEKREEDKKSEEVDSDSKKDADSDSEKDSETILTENSKESKAEDKTDLEMKLQKTDDEEQSEEDKSKSDQKDEASTSEDGEDSVDLLTKVVKNPESDHEEDGDQVIETKETEVKEKKSKKLESDQDSISEDTSKKDAAVLKTEETELKHKVTKVKKSDQEKANSEKPELINDEKNQDELENDSKEKIEKDKNQDSKTKKKD